jgi:hypothetical protein
MGMTMRMEYKTTNGVVDKYKARLCAMGNQQIAGIHFDERDLYAPVLKAAEVMLLTVIAAQLSTRQRFISLIPLRLSCMGRHYWGTWTRICMLELQFGGRKWCQKDIGSSFARISMGHGKLLGHSMCVSQEGWRSMNICLLTVRRQCS